MSGEESGAAIRARQYPCRRAHRVPRRCRRPQRIQDGADRACDARRGCWMKLSHQTIELNPTHPFVIARGGYSHHRNVIVRITDDDGLEGYGEAAPNRYYGESVPTVIAALGQFKAVLERADPFSLETVEAQLSRIIRGNASAKGAVSSALHDLVGKRLGLPVHRLWGLDASQLPQSSFTIAIAENKELERRVTEASEYPILKIKLGTERDMEIVRIVG